MLSYIYIYVTPYTCYVVHDEYNIANLLSLENKK